VQTAIDNLERVDMLGLVDDLDEFIGRLCSRLEISSSNAPRLNVGEPVDAPSSLRKRIAADNELDIEVYEAACARYHREAAGRRSWHPSD
jgi:hypothetical protein